MISCGITDKGSIRRANQDAFQISDMGERILAVVCDGIGGNKAGEVASDIASKKLVDVFELEDDLATDEQWLKDVIKKANEIVYKDGQENKQHLGMGTTLVAAIASNEKTIVGNVGDSRCYIVNNDDQMIQITEDHTLINYLVKERGLTLEKASQIVGKNVISRAIGIGPEVDVDTFVINEKYKYLLLCSDGLHGYVDEEVIRKVLLAEGTLEEKCNKFVQLANQAGGYDNITALIIER